MRPSRDSPPKQVADCPDGAPASWPGRIRKRPPGSGLEFPPLRATTLSEFAHSTLILERNGPVADTLTE